MQIAQHRPMPARQEQTTLHWPAEPMSPRAGDRVYQPLNFSVDDRLAEQHLTRLDLSSKNIKKIDKLPNNISFNVVLLDHNEISKVEHLDVLTHLIQLSISHNRLIDIRLIGRLRTLQKLNLSNNSLDSVECLKTLPNLVMLNIAGNHIHHIGALNACLALQSLDASDNAIRQIEDLSHLHALKYLNLHKNLIDTLASAPRYWPKSLHTLVISDNEIRDLAEVHSLSQLVDLNTLYIHDNPCLFVINDRHGYHQPFDYRPYVLNWCLSIQNLDGSFITRKESLKSEWLLSQGKGRSFRPGDHDELVQYLIKVCGTDADERDDLHLSRIMIKQDLYRQNGDADDTFARTSDTANDANATLSRDPQSKLQQSLLVSESVFREVSPSSSVSTINEASTFTEQRKPSPCQPEPHMRTPSPRYNRSISHHDEPTADYSSHTRYSDYDNRPIKPLDQNILQSKLNQYPIDQHSADEGPSSRSRATTNPQQPKRAASSLAYNANKYSPRTTARGPAVSTAMQVHLRPNADKNLAARRHDRAKRHTIAADTFNLAEPPTQRRPSALRAQHEQQITSARGTSHADEEGDVQLLSTQNTVELTRLTTSIESVRTSVLQAYLNLHERFTKTTELQTSALAALWKTFETQSSTHQRETERLLDENRSLSKRVRDLESRLHIKSQVLHPPLRAHISKRDTKSFFLHWIPNPLNETRAILGYRIYIDDAFKGSVDPGKFETVIDCIRDEGEYKIKLRAYNETGESDDSNVVIARFRRQQPAEAPESQGLQRAHSYHAVEDVSPVSLRQTHSQENMVHSPSTTSEQRDPNQVLQSMLSGGFPLAVNTASDPIIIRRPQISPALSPSGSDRETPAESNSMPTAKRSPARTGLMARLAKSPHPQLKRNNVLLNALPINLSSSPTEVGVLQSADFSDKHRPRSTGSVDTAHSTALPSSSVNVPEA